MRTLLTSSYMSAQRCCPARLDGRDHLELAEAHVSFVGSDPRGSMGAEYVRDFHGFSWLAGNGPIAATLPDKQLLTGYRALSWGTLSR